MKIIEARNYKEMSALAAGIIAAQVREKPDSVLGFATGSTPIGTYDALSAMNAAGTLDFSRVTTFNLDEYVGLPGDHPQSYRKFMWDHLFGKINILPGNVHLPCGIAEDFDDECAAYDAAIAQKGGLDLQLLGIGPDGHIGFNEPADVFVPGTHRTSLDPSTVKANARFFDSEDDVPRSALTMGIRTILSARKILLIANGEQKKKVLFEALEGAITPKNQASILQVHHDVTVIWCL